MDNSHSQEATLYSALADQKVQCLLCGHQCEIDSGKRGVCYVRVNRNGKLYSLVYGNLVASHVDPIEKKPLFHFYPGSLSYSVAAAGCNFQCSFCQNWQISQAPRQHEDGLFGKNMNPEDVVSDALRYQCRTISFTYTEPTVFFEYAYDVSKLAKEKGLDTIFVTNGFMSKRALEMISPYLDACNVDLKSFSEDFYKKTCKASLKPVLESIRLMKKLGLWIEITTLIVPDQNDSAEELSDIAGFIASIDPDIPWHISRFHPDFQMTGSGATPLESLIHAYEIGRKAGLHYIYVGNAPGIAEDTFCPGCRAVVIQRKGFSILNNKIKNGKCPFCGTPVAGRY